MLKNSLVPPERGDVNLLTGGILSKSVNLLTEGLFSKSGRLRRGDSLPKETACGKGVIYKKIFLKDSTPPTSFQSATSPFRGGKG